MARYVVYWIKNDHSDKILRYVVKTEKDINFPPAAVFPVSDRYPQDVQQARAREYCDYLNLLEEAKEKAAREITITNTIAKKLTGNLP